jgi:hypothetical protein
MGHAAPRTTLKYYQQSIPESVKSAAVPLEAEILKKAKAPAKVKASPKTNSATPTLPARFVQVRLLPGPAEGRNWRNAVTAGKQRTVPQKSPLPNLVVY